MRGTTEEILQILIESKWNLKSGTVSLPSSSRAYINRIKVEFKVVSYTTGNGTLIHINRIKVEFKERMEKIEKNFQSDINRIKVEFKEGRTETQSERKGILIESKWNLKKHTASDIKETFNILIESKWNLKYIDLILIQCYSDINRIKVEFKVTSAAISCVYRADINRIKVEFKGERVFHISR